MTNKNKPGKKVTRALSSGFVNKQIANSKCSAHVPSSRLMNKQIANSKRSAHVPSSRLMNKQIANSKRSQEEMVGFVLIIVLVSIIALVFLAISIRKPSEIKESGEIQDFLYSSLLATASCQAREAYNIKGLIVACSKGDECEEETACNVLNENAYNLVENSFQIGEEYKAYKLNIYEGNKTLLYLAKGNFTKNMIASEAAFYASGEDFKIRLELSY